MRLETVSMQIMLVKERATQAVFVTVVFSVPGSCSDGDIRLEGGSVGTSGNIQVCCMGLW